MRFISIASAVMILPLILSAVGCSSAPRPSAYLDSATTTRDIAKGEALYQSSRELLASDPVKAEQGLRECLSADLYHGPGHNDLGVLLLNQGKLYDAAFEFTWARKLLPGHPDPRLNLSIALDRGGKTDEAIAAAKAALDARPGYLPAIQAVAMYQINSKAADEATPGLLAMIVERSEDTVWRQWAERAAQRLRDTL